MNWLTRRRQVAYGFLAALATWLVFGALLWLFPSDRWPLPRAAYLTFIVVATGVTFLYAKAWLMGARARIITRLGVSLIAVNIAFGLILQLTLVASFWPLFFRRVIFSNPFGYGLVFTVNDLILAVFAVVVVWAAIELILTEDPIDMTTGQPEVWDGTDRRGDAPGRRVTDVTP